MVDIDYARDDDRIIAIMSECDIDWYVIKTSLGQDGLLYDELRVHIIGEPQSCTATANEFEEPFFRRLKEMEMQLFGETS